MDLNDIFRKMGGGKNVLHSSNGLRTTHQRIWRYCAYKPAVAAPEEEAFQEDAQNRKTEILSHMELPFEELSGQRPATRP